MGNPQQARSNLPSYEESCSSVPDSTRPATAGAFYRNDPTRMSISMRLCPRPSRPIDEQAWYRVLHVKCGNVPQMMRQGLTITSDNVVDEDGYIECTKDTSNAEFQDQWPYTRNY
ncbi:hypothetical protein PG993_006845 [Apiospora rasikravindrae]|uniref:Ig-like domain-containing protein n=1 Tax=Apiospora rasikravindrae TaxID=990691 RepID=A0ABR1SXI6_9PEZI